MQIVGTCGHCQEVLIGAVLCPSCWGTTVSPKALAEAKIRLESFRKFYADHKKAAQKLRGRARGNAGKELAQISEVGRALRAEIDRIEGIVAQNKAAARIVGAAAGSFKD